MPVPRVAPIRLPPGGGHMEAAVPGYTRVEVFVGRDGLGYYVPVYGNNRRGPRSEGYGHVGQPPATAIRLAERYARRDLGHLPVAEVSGR